MLASERVRWWAVVCLAVVQGMLFLVLLPPWQHYDEPTHFEYAWLIANRQRLPQQNDVDPALRREVAASMLAHEFYRDLPPPRLWATEPPALGISELGHPPGYYLLVSGPLRLARHLDVTPQLHIARSVSVALFVITVIAALGMMRELAPPGHPLRWAVPVALLLTPPIADVLTAVNNDAGAACIGSLCLWAAVRILQRGLNVWRGVALVTSALLAPFIKNTAAVMLLLPLLVFAVLWWRRSRRRWLTAGMAALVVAGMAALVLEWDAPAFWYPLTLPTALASDRSRVVVADTNQAALTLATGEDHVIGQPLSTATVYALRGRTITVGGWLWADQPGIGRLELVIGDETGASRLVALPSTLATTPTFTQHRVTIPTTAASISYAWPNVITPTTGLASRLWLQQPLLVTGSFSSATSPRWADAAYQQGTWDGQPFRNLLHNAGLEQTWPRPQPWLTERVVMYSRFNLATMLPALLDTQRTQPLLRMAGEQVLFSYFGAFAWGHIRLASAWQWLWLALGLGAAGGAIRWMWEHRRSHTNFGSLALLAALGAAVWSLAVLRILPALEARPFVPSARYVLPVLFPTTLFLVGGWWTPWPRRWRWLGLAVSLGMFGALEIAAVYQVWAYYHGGQ